MARQGGGTAIRQLAAMGALAYAGRRLLLRAAPADLRGQVVLITGGSRGLGLLLAREFAKAGCRLVLCARDERQLEAARQELTASGAEVLARRCDVADEGAVGALVAAATERFGGIDILVNNAGIIQVGPLSAMTARDFERAVQINFLGSVHTTLAVLPQMRARGAGRIVNITSIGGKVAVPHLLPYDCAKFALVGFSEGLRAELAGTGISVTTVVPGLMRTGSPPNALFKGDHAAEWTWFSLGDATPLTSMSAERAARRIVSAARRGEAEITLSWQAKLLRLSAGLFPGATAELLGVANRMLPEGGTETGQVTGMKLATALSPSPLTTLMNRAALDTHQYRGETQPSPAHARKVGVRG